jgi:hypothetical protein
MQHARVIALVGGAAFVASATVAAATWRREAAAPVAATSVGRGDAGAVPVEAAAPLWDTEERPGFTAGVAMRPMDREIIAAARSGNIDRRAMLDLFPDRPYRVRLAGSAELQQYRFVLIDLDRDGTWDERWDLGQPGQIRRELTPHGEAGPQAITFTIAHGRWQAH